MYHELFIHIHLRKFILPCTSAIALIEPAGPTYSGQRTSNRAGGSLDLSQNLASKANDDFLQPGLWHGSLYGFGV